MITSETAEKLVKDVGYIKGQLDLLLERHGDDHKRLGAIEKKQWLISGGTLAVAFFIQNKLQILRAVVGA
jgi:hypothetical protein